MHREGKTGRLSIKKYEYGKAALQKNNDTLRTTQGVRKWGRRGACAPRGQHGHGARSGRDAPSVTEAVLRPEREGRGGFELASRLGAIGADGASSGVDERAGRVHAQVGVVEVPAHVVGKLG